jgi:puromycin-sensitive aminopeptidase
MSAVATDAHLADPYRLPRTVLPRRYDLELAPQLDTSIFTGELVITVDVTAPTDTVVLNADELTIFSVRVDGTPAEFHLHEETERLVITPGRTLATGTATVSISFTGVLNDKLRGFYRSTYTDDAGQTQVIATTQMQPTDCRRAFPCFDEPDFKAVFGITLVVNNDLMAISNSPEVSRTPVDPQRVAVRFSDTMPMSTYIVAFIVGRLEATAPVDVNGTPMRVVHVPGKAHLADFGLRVGAYTLAWFQNYYGIPYPGEKVDLVALPDFAAGAMENLGCITFREVLLLVDPDKSTQMEQQLVADVVAHENAHMWFGDLVTMKWWNGIWLNEAFATFMEVAACDAFAPHWKRWTSFGLERSAAFEVDSLDSTRPVEFTVNSPADSEGMFDVLTYQKGGSLLRMLEMFLGQDRFRAGVSHYLRSHAYGNTETNDLWDAIEDSVRQGGQGDVPVRRLMDSWIWQPGYPLVSADIDGNSIVLRQQRFSFTETTDPTVWLVPIHLRNGAQETKVLLDTEAARVALPDANQPVVINAGGHGYYRVAYSPQLLARLDSATIKTLSVIERYNLVDDAWNAVVAGRLSAIDFLDFLAGFRDERDLAVWQAMAIGLRGCERLLTGHQQAPLQQRITNLVTPALADIGWEPAANEDDLTGKLRGLLIVLLACDASDVAAQQRAKSYYAAHEAGQKVHPEVVAAATTVVASTGGAAEFDMFVDKFKRAESPQEQLRNLYALADFQSAELITKACDFAFSGEVKTQNAPFLINRCMNNREYGHLAWRAARTQWDKANAEFPVNTIVRMVDPVKSLNTPELQADAQAFFAEHPIPQSAKTLEQILERQRINTALRQREGQRLFAALTA